VGFLLGFVCKEALLGGYFSRFALKDGYGRREGGSLHTPGVGRGGATPAKTSLSVRL